MGNTFSVGIDGVDEFMKALDAIGDKLALKTIKKASEKAAQTLLAETKAQCPADTGTLRDSIKLKKVQQKKKGFAGAQITTGKGFFQGQTYYGAMIEFGHKDRSGKQVPANPFMARANELKKNEVLNTLSDTIKHDIEEAARSVKK